MLPYKNIFDLVKEAKEADPEFTLTEESLVDLLCCEYGELLGDFCHATSISFDVLSSSAEVVEAIYKYTIERFGRVHPVE